MAGSPHVLMLFLDGVGVGKKDSAKNPFFSATITTFNELFGGRMPHLRDAHRSTSSVSLAPINATLGVAGLPQSGTGQTSLMTGINAARHIGKHFGPYPYSSLKPVIRERNIFHRLHGMEKKVFYANAFPRQFFEHIQSTKTRTTAITMSWMASGFALNDHHALAAGNALSADITSGRWSALGYPDMPILTTREAGRRLVEFTRQYDFVLYEYYFTDHAGHSQSMAEAKDVLYKLDGLLEGILQKFDHEHMTLIVTSDHGNLEDLSTKSHTRNPVPLLCVGRGHRQIIERVKNLTHVAPAVVHLLQ